jgi:hypothetical protein
MGVEIARSRLNPAKEPVVEAKHPCNVISYFVELTALCRYGGRSFLLADNHRGHANPAVLRRTGNGR